MGDNNISMEYLNHTECECGYIGADLYKHKNKYICEMCWTDNRREEQNTRGTTFEHSKEAKRKYSKRHYKLNRERILKQKRQRYHAKKES